MKEDMQRTALVYDFDGTLARGNVQEHSLLPKLGVSKDAFWAEVKRLKRNHDADEILVYMWHMLDVARQQDTSISKKELAEHGAAIPLFEGVPDWFDRINAYGRGLHLSIEHYIVSSGTQEIIDGCSIRSQFRNVFASRFIYDGEGKAIWPGVAINYTNKTQFLFRINKGIENTWDNDKINRWMPMNERPVPFSQMVFLGDGATDIPSMKMVRHQGGHSIAVFDPGEWDKPEMQEHVHRLISEDRAHFTVPACYTEGSQLDITVKGVLGRIARNLGYRGEEGP